MAELFFSAFLDVLFDRLATPDVLRFFRQLVGGVDSKIIAWKSEFQMIQGVLTDAEQRQLTDLDVKQWLDDLKHLVYDAEDILDDFANQALEQNLLAQHNQGIFNQFVGLVPAMISNYSMALQIEEITGRLAQLSEREGKLKLQRIPEGTSSTLQRPRTSSVPTESSVLGRSNDKDKILRMVITDSPSDDANIAVITIVGAGGVGKTTLAREVYNDKAVEDYVKAWVCVSDVFDVLGISKQLLQSITSDPRDLKTLDAVQVQLKKEVDGKKILMVLDDVWNEDHLLWDDLKAPFKCAASNIKIIVTTRNSQVAVAMEPTQKYNLQRLTDEDCWSLFMMQALDRSPAVFREKVVGKCGGLPLAAKILGGLLRFKNHNEWDTILDSNILHLLQQEQLKNSIVPVLGLSYHHLPSHLKRCFAYCAIFPKNYEFEKSELVLLWIAEGLMQQSGNEEPEEWGRKCFEVLLSRSIFEKSRGDCSKFVMHDLVHDVAQFVAGETIFKLDLVEANKSSRRFERVRHLSDNRDVFDVENAFQDLKFERLRTFLPISRTFRRSCIPSMFLSQLLQKFKLLRVLSLEGYCIIELPDSIGGLKLLKYLNLAGTVVISLPESICSLLNLQILILRNCRLLSKLPVNIGNLINLRHLNIKGAQKLKEMPLGIKDLKNLRKLSNFIVGKGGTVSGLKDLKNLKFIGGEICISGLENVENSNEDAALWDKENLEAVLLKWIPQFQTSQNEVEKQENMLDKLRPHESIKVLSIEHYVGAKFPQWMGDPSFSMMEVLTLENCKNCMSLPSLGLLGLLKRLIIKRMKKIKSIGFEFYGKDYSKPFQSLEILCFEDLQEWECWDINGLVAGCSNLRKLSILKCPKLSGKLPEHLPSLEELLVEKCSELIVSFSSYPILRKLEIDECKGLVCSTLIDSKLIDSMIISNSSLHVYGRKGMMHDDLTAAESRSVTTTNILELGKFLEQGFHQVKSLVMMSRVSRESRVLGWKNQDFYYELTYNKLEFQRQRHRSQRGIHVLTFTDEVSFEKGCLCLVRFPEIDFFLKNLRSLKIYGCSTLESLPKEITGTDSNSKLELLFISFCDSLTSIGKLPSSLKTLEIYDCEKLRRLFDGEEGASSFSSVRLKFLRISACPELTSLSLGTQSLEALEDLQIAGCPKLESIPDGLHKLNCLKRIKISSCPSIVSFPEGGLPNTISEFDIQDCEKLEALPNDMHILDSLKYLRIRRCPSVVSFPGEGFPTNLTSLFIEIVKVYKPWIERGLHRLTSLTTLDIEGWDEEMEFMLPASLTHLSLRRFSKLKSLSSRCQSLTSLRSLVIDDCPNLKSFPEEGFPSSLAELCIIRCPMLKEACKRDKGKEWFKIAQIPFVWIDCKSIYEELESESE